MKKRMPGRSGTAQARGEKADGSSPKPQTKGMIVATQPMAVEAGVQMLRKGGNAIDAAIATAWAQGIVDPFVAGPGGFGCLLVYSSKERKATMIDFHGRCGSKATPDLFQKAYEGRIYGHADRVKVKGDINQVGYLAVVTPGTVAGLYTAWKRFGSLPWGDLFEPAIRLGYDGFSISGNLAKDWTAKTESSDGVVPFFRKVQTTGASAKIFLNKGKPWKPGERLVQKDHARTLERIAAGGMDTFYRGELAQEIVEDFRKRGGLLTQEDFENYKVDVYEPVRGTYRGYEIVSSPLPGSGPQVIQILNIMEGYDISAMEHNKAPYVELLARAQRLSFIDRVRYHGDPKFSEDKTRLLISKDYAAELRKYLDRGTFPEDIHSPSEVPGTTHMSVVDEDGNCVAFTQTLGSASGVVTEGLGFTYNNCMFQFNPMPGKPNSIEPGKARITGISPTILFRKGRPFLVLGASGGTRILASTQHMINNVIDHGMTVVEAVSAPRWHWEDRVIEMEPRIYHHVRAALEAKGLSLKCTKFSYDPAFSVQNSILIDPRSGRLHGGGDPRGGCGVATP